ncbi:hypothetical protein JXQ70_07725 [bacterium]|nr:hypothetical protein [bacterium]
MKKVCLIASMMLLVPALLCAQETMSTTGMALENSVGIGYGLPYGVLGVNADLKLFQNLYMTLGMGTVLVSDDIAYNLGLRYFFFGPEKSIRPRITVMFGANSIVEVDMWDRGPDNEWDTADDFVDESEWRRYQGWTAGAGVQWNFGATKKYGLDLDVMYNFYSQLDVDEIEEKDHETADEPDDVSVSLGFRINM